jgi:hypothetical protein
MFVYICIYKYVRIQYSLDGTHMYHTHTHIYIYIYTPIFLLNSISNIFLVFSFLNSTFLSYDYVCA